MSIILDTLTRAILTSGKTRYRIAKESGVSEAQLSKLVRGLRGLTIETAEKLAPTMGLRITITPDSPNSGWQTPRTPRKAVGHGKH